MRNARDLWLTPADVATGGGARDFAGENLWLTQSREGAKEPDGVFILINGQFDQLEYITDKFGPILRMHKDDQTRCCLPLEKIGLPRP